VKAGELEQPPKGSIFFSVKIRNKGISLFGKSSMSMVLSSMKKGEFPRELFQKIQRSNIPLMIGGFFNIIRYTHEKSTGANHSVWMDMFNNFIYDTT
jgi:hypothetical protein